MKFALLTGGGDCSGMNAFVRGAVRCALNLREQSTVYGVMDGWKGLIYNDYKKLGKRDVAGMGQAGGTILGTVRMPELATNIDMQRMAAFNLGDYRKSEAARGGLRVEVFANRKVETALSPRPVVLETPMPSQQQRRRPIDSQLPAIPSPPPTPNPSAHIKRHGK